VAALLTDRRRAGVVAAILVLLVALIAAWPNGPSPQPGARAAGDEVRILGGAPATLDPAAAGDAGSAAVISQLFETLTAIDPSLTVRPALAERWELADDGRRVTFHLRDGLRFSDGTPLDADDVVRSWLRVIDPQAPSPLASLMLDVEGARAYLAGEAGAGEVGLRADGRRVEVDLVRPAGEFPSVVASPTFAVVPEGVGHDPGALDDRDFVGSGGYVLAEASESSLRLERNESYWAGPPAIATVHLVGDLEGRSGVQAFEAGDLDYAPIGDFDASWIRFDPDLGPRLRAVPALSTEYLGFDTTRPPFDDVRVRQAFAQAVDWSRLVRMAGSASVIPATSMVPPGIPGRSDRSFLPPHDPDAARELLAEAGFPEGRGFPEVTYLTGGSTVDGGFVADVERELGIDVRFEAMDFDTYFGRLDDEPPQIWSLSWIADYPGANDFLGVLLHSESSNNYGGWANAEFDAAIAEAGETTDPDEARAAYDRAETILQQQAPVIPLAHSPGWALARDGLLGATENGLGSLRFAGLAWDD
jgi:ABC-type oligopeptide transport system substrate-binding subunit